jgi:hypothetical protein
MSDKKPDFDSLDFTAVSKEKADEAAVAEEVQKDAEAEEEKVAAPPKKSERNYNAWIDGTPIQDVTAEQMADWVNRLVGVELDVKDFDTPQKRVKAIDKVLHINRKLAYLNIGHTNKDQKEYSN